MDRGAWQAIDHGVARVRHDLATKPPPSTMFIGRDKDDIGKIWQGILQGVSKIWQKRIPAAAKSLQSCPTLCDPTDGSPPGSPVPGILQARTLEWVAVSFSNAGKWKVKVKSLNCVRPLVWTAASQAPLSMGFSRQKYWSGVPLPSPREFLPQTNFLVELDFMSNWESIPVWG